MNKSISAFFETLFLLIGYFSFLVVVIEGARNTIAKHQIWPRHWPAAGWIYTGQQPTDFRVRRDQLLHRLEDPLRRLIVLVRKYMRCSDENLAYGLQTKTYSRFYIDTMEAAQDEADLTVMVDLLKELLRRNASAEHPPNPHFVLVPKGGNPLLGRRFAEEIRALSVLAKAREDSAFVAATDQRAEFRINFEGVERVLQLEQQEREKGKQLYGICVDCNVSGGRGVREAVEQFNTLRAALGLHIEMVNAIYVLLRASDIDPDTETFEQEFSNRGFVVYRYFDLSEKAKQALYELELPDTYSERVLHDVDGIVEYLANKRLLKGIH